ncbi:glycosyltransferase family 2 protein [Calorimonas adulescens]|uniref:Glucosyl-3-phosphoglycerate synthase n=1 Tax=Calorimonas adulescens TaxID=2606906 RepID=A0A5D8QJ55_9THEO|nr:glycosyltransferase family 2 protein [Calorimonas adulescens]TZE83318.1 glycosyltransferase family 2 protein [Calorimonas adulescens]
MTVSALIPAFNEEKTVGNVVDVLKHCERIDEIIVINDGSSDNTSKIAKSHGVHVIDLEQNIGKGGAICRGLQVVNGDIILILDADLIGLKKNHVNDMINPILFENVDMTIGIFTKGRTATDLAQKFAPFLSGQRAVKKAVLDSIDNLEISRYGFEIALTKYADKQGLDVKEVYLENLTHIMKEEKMGLYKGMKARVKMYFEIIKSFNNL